MPHAVTDSAMLPDASGVLASTLCSPFGASLLARLRRAPNGSASALELAGKSKRIAAESALRAMERRGLVGRFCHPKDAIWSTTYWFARTEANINALAPAGDKTTTKEENE